MDYARDAMTSKNMPHSHSEIMDFVCPFCCYSGPLNLMGADRFPVLKELQVIGAGRRAARCPDCNSTDKERLVFCYLKDVEKIDKKSGIAVLHIAPEKNLMKWLQDNVGDYIAGDAFLQNQEFLEEVIELDILGTEFPDNHFDYIICNHVICDIKDDVKALSEIYRLLKPGGQAIIQVPITKISDTVHYDYVSSKEEREQAYGYGYHERIYNNEDYKNLLSKIGFVVKVSNISFDFPTSGLNEREDLYICSK